ncbi:MAG: sister chromatid cohesion protein PDS5, partial [Bacteroidota bacterium]
VAKLFALLFILHACTHNGATLGMEAESKASRPTSEATPQEVDMATIATQATAPADVSAGEASGSQVLGRLSDMRGASSAKDNKSNKQGLAAAIANRKRKRTVHSPMPTKPLTRFKKMESVIDRDIHDFFGCEIIQNIVKAGLRADYIGQLSQLKSALKSSVPEARLKAISAMHRLAKEACFLMPEVLGLLLGACKDTHTGIVMMAAGMLPELTKAVSGHTEGITKMLITACKDADQYVRSAATSALSKLVEVSPTKAVFSALLAVCKDDSFYVREAAIRALGELLKATPIHAQAALRALLTACKDDIGYIRSAAVSALGKLITAAPAHAEDVLKVLLETACSDNEFYVRRTAAIVLGQLVKANADYAESVLKELFAACKDTAWHVREVAVNTLSDLITVAPAHAEATLQVLLTACKDTVPDVRSTAVRTLGELVKSTPAYVRVSLRALQEASEDERQDLRGTARHVAKSVLEDVKRIIDSGVVSVEK